MPPIFAAALLLGHVYLMYRAALSHTAGTISYPVDDAFIHLALAKHLALDGVYGVSPREFASVSSSIGWPLLLAIAIRIVGSHASLPLLLNAILGVVLVFVADRSIRSLSPKASLVARTICLLAVVVFTPLPTLVVLGMEHTAHAIATIVLVHLGSKWLARDESGLEGRNPRIAPLLLASAAVTSFRYEGAFPVALVALLAFVRGRRLAAVLVAASGALPILLFGVYSIAHGGLFLPNPVLLKGRHVDFTDLSALGDLLGGDLMDRLGGEGHVYVIACATAALGFAAAARRGFWSTSSLALAITFVTILMHIEFASLGWFYRYESYLLATALTFTTGVLTDLFPSRAEIGSLLRSKPLHVIAPVIAVFVATAPLARRAVAANSNTPTACRNIFEQQMQSARFLSGSFSKDRVAVNDIGAVAWLGADHIVDLVGLATLPIAKAKQLKLDQPLPPADLLRLTAGVKVAIVYDEWFKEGLPPQWVRVGRWRIENNKSCAFPSVAIYATDPASYAEVIDALRKFAPSLPEGIAQEGRYTERPRAVGTVAAGDHLILKDARSELTGSLPVDDDGTVAIPKVGKILVRGSIDQARAAVDQAIEKASGRVGSARLEHLEVVHTRASKIRVVSRAGRPIEIESGSLTLEAAVAATPGASSEHVATTWVLRERDDGTFAKIASADLGGGALLDGDLVVVP